MQYDYIADNLIIIIGWSYGPIILLLLYFYRHNTIISYYTMNIIINIK